MADEMLDPNSEMMLDGNAAAGMMMELFGVEMTAAPTVSRNVNSAKTRSDLISGSGA